MMQMVDYRGFSRYLGYDEDVVIVTASGKAQRLTGTRIIVHAPDGQMVARCTVHRFCDWVAVSKAIIDSYIETIESERRSELKQLQMDFIKDGA